MIFNNGGNNMDDELTVNIDIGADLVKFTIIGRIYSSNADIFEKHLEKALEKRYIIWFSI